jgi:hypothetical protein
MEMLEKLGEEARREAAHKSQPINTETPQKPLAESAKYQQARH